MGNKLSRKRQLVDERYTRPQGLYPNNDVDQKKLKKLILDSKLAPCYPGDEDCAFDLEECPICFLYYPSLNRSRCCTKGICTECFLQMKPPHATRPTQCPFCKTCNYAVEYRGMRTKEEKGIEQVEEQRVIEAKIRMQQQEVLEDEERTKRRLETSSSRRIVTPDEVGYRDLSSSSHAVPSYNIPVGSDEIDSSHDSQTSVLSRQPSQLRQNRGDQFDVDLEDLMVMEAIWLSIQENGTQRLLTCGDAAAPEHANEDHYAFPAVATTSQAPSPSGGLACAIAALAERQHMDRDPTTDPGNTSTPDMHPESCGSAAPDEETDGYASESWVDISADSRAAFPREEGEWGTDIGSEVAEAGTSYASSDATVELRAGAIPMPNSVVDHCQHNILPETFEEQMMLAMAVSLTDARARSNSQGVAWL